MRAGMYQPNSSNVASGQMRGRVGSGERGSTYGSCLMTKTKARCKHISIPRHSHITITYRVCVACVWLLNNLWGFSNILIRGNFATTVFSCRSNNIAERKPSQGTRQVEIGMFLLIYSGALKFRRTLTGYLSCRVCIHSLYWCMKKNNSLENNLAKLSENTVHRFGIWASTSCYPACSRKEMPNKIIDFTFCSKSSIFLQLWRNMRLFKRQIQRDLTNSNIYQRGPKSHFWYLNHLPIH